MQRICFIFIVNNKIKKLIGTNDEDGEKKDDDEWKNQVT